MYKRQDEIGDSGSADKDKRKTLKNAEPMSCLLYTSHGDLLKHGAFREAYRKP